MIDTAVLCIFREEPPSVLEVCTAGGRGRPWPELAAMCSGWAWVLGVHGGWGIGGHRSYTVGGWLWMVPSTGRQRCTVGGCGRQAMGLGAMAVG